VIELHESIEEHSMYGQVEDLNLKADEAGITYTKRTYF
jgi:hypothetical protein